MKKVYLDYTSEALSAEYNNRGKVPEYEAIVTEWAHRSDRFRSSNIRSKLDQSYGSGVRSRFDLFLPDVENPPLHIFIHGGYWQWNEKEHYAFLAEPFISSGTAFANLEYPLCPNVTMGEIIGQIRNAIYYLWKNASKLGFNRDNILVSGHSAGGHLTGIVMTTDWLAIFPDIAPSPVKYCLPISGIYDLEPLRYTPISDALNLDDDLACTLSPMFSPPRIDARVIIALGALEGREFHRQSEEFAANCRRHGMDVEIRSVFNCNHFTILEELAKPEGTLFKVALALQSSG